MNVKSALAVVAAVATTGCLVAPGAAQAAQIGFYVGGQFGQSDRAGDIAGFDSFAQDINDFFEFVPNTATTRSSLDESDSAYGFMAGYRFTPHIAIEGGYFDIGALAYRYQSAGAFAGNPATFTQNFDSESSGITLAVLGVLPLSYRWEVYARAGAMFSTNTFKIFLSDGGEPLRDEFSESSTDMLAGVGTSFTFLEIYDARLEFQRIFDAGDEATSEGDADVITLGVTVAF